MSDAGWRPLTGILVIDLTRYLPGPFAGREMMRLGARVVRLESPDGDPLRCMAPGWHEAVNAGKESVVCDLKRDAAFGRALCARADVVLEGFRPGVAERLGIGPADLPASVIYCSITGFGRSGDHAQSVGHDLNYLGYAGALAEAPDVLPHLPVADLAAGALMAVNQILAALLERGRTGKGRRLEVSMTHNAHRLVSYRVSDSRPARLLHGQFACYRTYRTADGRHVTVAAIEPRFFRRLCELVGHPELARGQFEAEAQDELADTLSRVFSQQTLGAWMEQLYSEDVAVGPVSSLQEAWSAFGERDQDATLPELGEHTQRWRWELGQPEPSGSRPAEG